MRDYGLITSRQASLDKNKIHKLRIFFGEIWGSAEIQGPNFLEKLFAENGGHWQENDLYSEDNNHKYAQKISKQEAETWLFLQALQASFD